jgi:hypothetical protein
MGEADQRIHGTTFEPPALRFARDEARTLRPLPSVTLPVRDRRVTRRVANDCFVDLETIRYSVPHRLVKRSVEVAVTEVDVRIFDGREEVARHRRCFEPHQRVVDPKHFEGLYRVRDEAIETARSPMARSLEVYAAAAAGGAP